VNDERKVLLIRAFVIPVAALFVTGIILFLLSRILLAVSVDVAPFLALLVALIVFLTAALIALRPQIDFKQAAGLGGVLFAALAAGGIAAWFIGERHLEPHEPEALVQIAANNLAFDTDTLNVPAGEEFVIEFDNQEDVPHNVAIYSGEDLAEAFFQGEVFNGPATRDYEVEALEAGEYFFQCDVHPAQMQGTVVAAEFAEEGSPTEQHIAANALQFDVTELRFPAEQEVSLVFENQEEVPHNVSLYTDESASEAIFVGEIQPGEGEITYEFTAPAAGEYYFHCDVHPQQMFGTVIIE
jgi:plastocyanin